MNGQTRYYRFIQTLPHCPRLHDVQEVAGLIKTFKRSRDMMKAISGGGIGAMKSLLSGKMDIFSAMSSGGKHKGPQPRRRSPRR
jgi:hypothetical protein